MALQATVESLDGIPEVLHDHYEQDGDVYRLRVDGYEDTALRNSLDFKKKEVARLKKQLDEYDGVPADEVKQLLELRVEYEDKVAQAGSWEDQKERLEARKDAEHERKLERVTSELIAEREKHHSYRLRNEVISALNEAGARVEALDDKVLKRARIEVDELGEFQVVAKSLNGEAETDLPSLVKEMKQTGKYDWGFLPNGNSGSGAATGTGGGTAGQVRSKKDLKSAADKSRYIAEHGSDVYLDLPAE